MKCKGRSASCAQPVSLGLLWEPASKSKLSGDCLPFGVLSDPTTDLILLSLGDSGRCIASSLGICSRRLSASFARERRDSRSCLRSFSNSNSFRSNSTTNFPSSAGGIVWDIDASNLACSSFKFDREASASSARLLSSALEALNLEISSSPVEATDLDVFSDSACFNLSSSCFKSVTSAWTAPNCCSFCSISRDASPWRRSTSARTFDNSSCACVCCSPIDA
mmetsp:Transcript_58620/g.92661  ORF Transcript_58620/g.92661 Transcript_58620/m.92661 type:complete len:222 (-) Transcript_58620:552-1217(-)